MRFVYLYRDRHIPNSSYSYVLGIGYAAVSCQLLTKCVDAAALDCNTVARHYNTTINQKLSAYRSSDNEISFCLAILSGQQQYMLVVLWFAVHIEA